MLRFLFSRPCCNNIIKLKMENIDIELNKLHELLEMCECVELSMNEKVLYCVDEKFSDYSNIDFALSELGSLEDVYLLQFWSGKLPIIILEGCNEWAIRLMRILRRENVRVVLRGEIWNVMGFYLNDNDIEGEQLIVINSEKKWNDLYQEYYFIMELLQFNRWVITNKAKQYVCKLGAKAFCVAIPEFKDLNDASDSEKWRNQKRLNITNGMLDLGEEEIENELQKLYGDHWKKLREDCADNSNQHWLRMVTSVAYYLRNRKSYSVGRARCYLIGPCIVEGKNVEAKSNFPQLLSEYINLVFPDQYSVVAIAVPFYVVKNYINIVKSLSIHNNDIIICIDEVCKENTELCDKFWGFKTDIDLEKKFSTRRQAVWFADKPIHTTALGNQVLADTVGKYISDKIRWNKEEVILQKAKGYLLDDELEQLDEYLDSIDRFEENGRIGAIVMNCNPMTLGHEYLIDYARGQVDYLYIFVVEENKSLIPFQDRYAMVYNYVKKLDNVKVNPSGNLIISQFTLPMYFEKEEKKKIVIDAWRDIDIFAQYIVPNLNISQRFVGEETQDYITWQYNREMERTLVEYGCQLIEIPRKVKGNSVISATNVRRYLNSQQWEEVKKLVSEETFQYLYSKYRSACGEKQAGCCH